MANIVCPASLYTGATTAPIFAGANVTSYVTGTGSSTSAPNVVLYNPLANNRTVTISVRGTNYTVNLVSITKIIEDIIYSSGSRRRYEVPATGYWSNSLSTTLATGGKNVELTNYLINNNIPGKTGPAVRKYILPTSTGSSSLQGGLTGDVGDAKESISYDLLYSLQYEFCYYSKVFATLMNDYLKIGNDSTFETADGKSEKQRPIVNQLNSVRLRLNDLTEISSYIGNYQRGELSTLNTQVNQFVTGIKASVDELNKNAIELLKKDKETGLRYRQLEFSEEKNAYANQLLAMYGFANLIALGLLFYIYKS